MQGYFSTATEKLDAIVTGLHLIRLYQICVWDTKHLLPSTAKHWMPWYMLVKLNFSVMAT